MTTIHEEEEDFLPEVDFSDLLDLDNGTFAETHDTIPGGTLSTDFQYNARCPSHPNNDCLCHGFLGDFDVPQTTADLSLTEPDYSRLEDWIPRLFRPEKPCDYCRSRRLNCYLSRGEASCKPCLSLFRECSLTNSRTLEASNHVEGNSIYLDTLHAVDEHAITEQGALTGIKLLASKRTSSGSITPVRADDAPGSTKRNGIRFPRHAVKILRDWLDTHTDHPYPTEEEKADLERRTELKPSQIANWLANARRRRKVTERVRPKLCSSPSLQPTTPAIAIPAPADKPWDELNPFERWQHSPPENDPASITDIAHAVAFTELPDGNVSRSPSSGRRKRSSNGSGFSSFKAASTTSLDTSGRSSSSTAASSTQTHGSFGSFSSGLAGKRDRRRRRKPTATVTKTTAADDKKRIFQCTFCTDTFKSKYDWTRHEKSLHLSLEKWICAPLGPVVTDAASGRNKCVYCETLDPSDDHIEAHNHRPCEDKGMDARTFFRKDHLRQHLRLMHGCEMTGSMDSWESTAVNIRSRCGFCAQRFTIWQERVDHLTAHFKAGARMIDWKGCRGLDPAVAAQVTNAMPPYLIGIESVSPNPFSATNRGTWRQGLFAEGAETLTNMFEGGTCDFEGGSGYKATCWEIATVRLGQYANEMAQKGIVLTDEMLQQQARRVLYDSDDAWDQTPADNPEWLDLFKKAHGLDYIPTAVGGTGIQVPGDLETYTDLGLRIPFAVQLQAYGENQSASQSGSHAQNPLQCRVNSQEHSFDLGQGYLSEDQLRWTAASRARAQGLSRLATQVHAEECNCEEPKPKGNSNDVRNFADNTDTLEDMAAARARFRGLSRLTNQESERCTFYGINAQEEARARARGLAALSSYVDVHVEECSCDEAKPRGKGTYLSRHKFELPPEKARRFATITGAWKDSGMMPEAIATASLAPQPTESTTTGAMMEFLGGDIGGNLPFSNDGATSDIPMPSTTANEIDWTLDLTAPGDSTDMLMDLDDLIAATSGPQQFPAATTAHEQIPLDTSWMATGEALMPMSIATDVPNDFVMEDLDFDDMTFGGVFDIPADDVAFGANEVNF